MGASTYTQAAVNLVATIIGPRARAGFTAPPVTGPAISTPQARANPTARGAAPAGALSSVATEITTKTRMKVTNSSTTNAWMTPTPSTGNVAARLASSRPAPPKVIQVPIAARTAPRSCAPRYVG